MREIREKEWRRDMCVSTSIWGNVIGVGCPVHSSRMYESACRYSNASFSIGCGRFGDARRSLLSSTDVIGMRASLRAISIRSCVHCDLSVSSLLKRSGVVRARMRSVSIDVVVRWSSGDEVYAIGMSIESCGKTIIQMVA